MATGICLATSASGEAALDRLKAALAAVAPASILILPPAHGRYDTGTARSLVAAAQAAHAAALLVGDAGLAKSLGADGVHLPYSDDIEDVYREARRTLGAGAIVGVDCGSSRHAAMSLGEAGADYIAFGLGHGAPAGDEARRARGELVAWWAELFEVPVVALDVTEAGEAAELAAAGADFISLALDSGMSPAGAAEQVKATAAALGALEQAAL